MEETGNGAIQYDGFIVSWTFYTKEVAIITNGSGGLVLTTPVDVREIFVDDFIVQEKSGPLRIDRRGESVLILSLGGEKIARLDKMSLPPKGSAQVRRMTFVQTRIPYS